MLTGKVAAEAGMFAPLAFVLAALIASVTAFSYAELSSRYPRSAGEAAYVLAAFSNRNLSRLTGWAIVLTGVVSAATLANGFVGYFQVFVVLPDQLIIFGVVASLGLLAIWGIKQSMNTAAAITLIEIVGLLIIIAVSSEQLATLPAQATSLIPDAGIAAWTGIMAGTFLAFYAFIGFEDMVNVAEEVVNPSITIPVAIGIAITFSTLLYFIVSVTAVLSLPLDELSNSTAPFALIMERNGYSSSLISLISLIAIVNGTLVQIIMASRVIYGMADQGSAPAWMASISHRTRTPVNATTMVTAIIMILALALPLVSLAKATSFIVLIVFAAVNLSLIRIKLHIGPCENAFSCPIIMPIAGTVLCLGLLAFSGSG